MARLVDGALVWYSRLGWSLVVLEPGAKRPLAGRRWIRSQRERANVEETLALLRAHPDAGLGLVTGSVSGVAVVDIDDPTAVLPVKIPDGPFVESATPGHRHIYFAAPRPVPTARNLFGQKVELLGERALAVLPPSEFNARAYSWHGNPAHGLPPLPPEILRAAQAAAKRMPMAVLLRGVMYGQRNISAARVVGFLLHRAGPSEEAWAAVVAWNARNVPPLETAELRAVFDSILHRHRRWIARLSPDPTALGPLENLVLRYLARAGGAPLWRVHEAVGGEVARHEVEDALRTLIRLGEVKLAGLTRRGVAIYRFAPASLAPCQTPRREAPEPSQTTTPVDLLIPHTLGVRNDTANPPSNHLIQPHTSLEVVPGLVDVHPAGVVAAPAAAPEVEAEREVAVALPSMRLLDETLPDGSKVVHRRLRDGRRILAFRGTLDAWLAWTPPEILRDESRMAEWPRVGG